MKSVKYDVRCTMLYCSTSWIHDLNVPALAFQDSPPRIIKWDLMFICNSCRCLFDIESWACGTIWMSDKFVSSLDPSVQNRVSSFSQKWFPTHACYCSHLVWWANTGRLSEPSNLQSGWTRMVVTIGSHQWLLHKMIIGWHWFLRENRAAIFSPEIYGACRFQFSLQPIRWHQGWFCWDLQNSITDNTW